MIEILLKLLPVLLPVLLECFKGMGTKRQEAFIRWVAEPNNSLQLTGFGIQAFVMGDPNAAVPIEVSQLVDEINARLK